jgi:predicted glycosyltransferase
VVVTAGGGGDGKRLFETVLTGLRRRPDPVDFDCLLVGGPLLDDADRARLKALADGVPGVHLLDFTEEMTSYLGAADVVVSMGGYNSVCELLSLERPAIIVPRVRPREEQLIRAETLSRLGLVRMIHPDRLSPRLVMDAVTELLAEPAARRPRLRMDGLPGVAEALRAVLPPASTVAMPPIASDALRADGRCYAVPAALNLDDAWSGVVPADIGGDRSRYRSARPRPRPS